MGNHTEILRKIAERLRAFDEAGGDLEEDLWPSASDVLREINQILDSADPPITNSTSED
ncbi:MAG: hypothetical protein V3U24_06720 [Candidatus Neomarinimicrobiota bacterium]